MTELRELLRQGVGPRVTPLDFDGATEQARRFQSRRRGAAMAGVVAVVALLLVAVPGFEGSNESGVRTVGPADRVEAGDHESPRPGIESSDPSPAKGATDQPAGRGGAAPSGPGDKDAATGGSLPVGTTPERSEVADPPVSYTDQAGDAYVDDRTCCGRSGAPLNQKAFDILRVDWAPASKGYSTSITLAGTASEGGSYISFGSFDSADAGRCQLRHYLTPGTTAFAEILCPGGRSGRVQGGQVTATPTPAGGTLLAATFDSRAIPASLQAAGRTLHDLSASTCVGGGEADCSWANGVDGATSSLTYRV
jgi:hypothetical protein